MRRPIALLAICSAMACAASPHARANDRPAADSVAVDSPSHGHAAVDVSGLWGSGSTGEPAGPRILLHTECNYTPTLWALSQSGDVVSTSVIPESRGQGIPSRQMAPKVGAVGKVSGVDVVMETTGARYVLRYDSTSGHLRGTLNGTPFWAVRLDLVRPAGCIPPP